MNPRLLPCCLFAVLALLSACTLAAQQQGPCADPRTQAEINACAAEKYREADNELQRLYKTLRSVLGERRKAELDAAQDAWTRFRDAHCRYASSEFKGTSMHPTILYGCLTSLTQERIVHLRDALGADRRVR